MLFFGLPIWAWLVIAFAAVLLLSAVMIETYFYQILWIIHRWKHGKEKSKDD